MTTKKCYVCTTLTEWRKEAKAKNDFEWLKNINIMMFEHLNRVKYRNKHGWKGES